MTRVIRYGRKSPNGWDDEGATQQMQDERTLAYCTANDLTPVGPMLFDMFESSATLERPELRKALAMIDTGDADGLVVYRLDRLTRSLTDLLALIAGPFAEGRAQLHSLHEKLDTASATGRLMIKLLGSINEWSREIIAENTRATLRSKRLAGCYIGGVPYGWRRAVGPDGKLTALEPVPQEQAAIRVARQLWDDGVSQDRIAKVLVGFPTRSGRPWSRRGVQCILSQPHDAASMSEAGDGQEA